MQNFYDPAKLLPLAQQVIGIPVIAVSARDDHFHAGIFIAGSLWKTSLAVQPRQNHVQHDCGNVFRDISERKRAEEELRAHRDTLEHLVEDRTAGLHAGAGTLKNPGGFLPRGPVTCMS
jgi:hypothetical protein